MPTLSQNEGVFLSLIPQIRVICDRNGTNRQNFTQSRRENIASFKRSSRIKDLVTRPQNNFPQIFEIFVLA